MIKMMYLFYILLITCFISGNAFTPMKPAVRVTITELNSKKKGPSTPGKGFGKVESKSTTKTIQTPETSSFDVPSETIGFSSVDGATSFEKPKIDIDPNLSTQDRTKEILKQQFGLRSIDEKQADLVAAQKAKETKLKIERAKQMKDEEFDIFMLVPPPILKGIDFFLKAGLSITTILFVLAGIGITAEAWSAATGGVLPDDVDTFIVNVVEPNFTTGLFVLLGFSISLGLFATAQLGSGSSIYREDS
jgi:hypothetical protein